MHGGTVGAASDGPGQGSEFIVRLPAIDRRPDRGPASLRSQAEPQAWQPRAAACSWSTTTSTRRESLGLLLGQMGHDVQVAHDGATALEAAQSGQPHIVLLDIGMPGVDGYSVVRRLRQEPVFRNVPFVAVTGRGHDDDRDRARDAGFDEHLVKPVALESLRGYLRRF